MQIVNQSRVDFQYRLDDKEPIIRKTIFSNKVLTDVVNDRLKIEKKVDKETACVFEILRYTIIISNLSNNVIENIFLKDLINEKIKFINGSTRVNGVKKRCVNPNEGFNIGNIQEYSTISIDFKVVVLPGSSLYSIKNQSYITYDHIYNIEMPPKKITIVTNEVSTFIENRLFKQINIGNRIKIPWNFSNIKNNSSISVKINILKTKIISANMSTKSNDWKLDLCKLIVIGSIEYFVTYKSKELKQSVKSIKTEGFSTFMSIPCGVEYCNDYKVEHKVENILTSILDEKNLFVDTEILLTL